MKNLTLINNKLKKLSINLYLFEFTGAGLNYSGLDVMLHMTCCSMTKSEILQHLRRAKDIGLRNILALRGGKIFLDYFLFPF